MRAAITLTERPQKRTTKYRLDCAACGWQMLFLTKREALKREQQHIMMHEAYGA